MINLGARLDKLEAERREIDERLLRIEREASARSQESKQMLEATVACLREEKEAEIEELKKEWSAMFLNTLRVTTGAQGGPI